jgi:hypothetical protein
MPEKESGLIASLPEGCALNKWAETERASRSVIPRRRDSRAEKTETEIETRGAERALSLALSLFAWIPGLAVLARNDGQVIFVIPAILMEIFA